MTEYAPLCEKQSLYIKRSVSSWLNVAEGGKRAGKNIINILAWTACLQDHPDKLHLAGGVSLSAVKLNILDSNGFGLEWIFKGKCRKGQYEDRDALFIQTRTGEKVILLAGGRDKGSEAKIKGQTYGTVYITEANECAEEFVKECVTRTLTSHDRKLFMDLNPKAPQHWYYVDFLNFYDREAAAGRLEGYNYAHFTVADNLSLSVEQLRELLKTYDKESFWYASDILGLRTSPNGLIYDMWTDGNLYDDDELTKEMRARCQRVIAVDYGTTNPMVYLDILYDGHTGWIEHEYYYDSRRERKQKTDYQYADDFERFVGYDHSVTLVIDPSASSFRAELSRRGYHVRLANNDVLDGLRMTATMISLRRIRARRGACPNVEREVAAYVWNEKAVLRGEEDPLKENDHAMDALRYFVKTIVRKLN